MNYKDLRQIFSLRDLRNAFLGLSVVVGGIGLALVTVYAQHTDNPKLAGFAAITSLVFVVLIIFFIVPPLARSASAEASQLNLPFEFTVGGAIFLGLLVVVGFAAWNTGNNLLFLVLAFLVSALIVSFFFGNFALKKFDVKMRFPETIFAGEADTDSSSVCTIANAFFRPFPSSPKFAAKNGRALGRRRSGKNSAENVCRKNGATADCSANARLFCKCSAPSIGRK